jgi:hypothetical protein
MSIKKMMMLAMSLAALVAFAAPAAASAHLQWYESGEPDVLLGGEAELHVVGELSTSVPEKGLVNELCPVTFTGTASNTGPEGAAHGLLTSGNVNHEEECKTNLSFAGCNISKATLNFTNGWTLTTATPDHVIIDNATFTNFYSEACKAFGVPPIVPASGSVEGTLTNGAGPNGEDCISFEESTGLAIEGGGPAVTLDGEVCITLPLTLH